MSIILLTRHLRRGWDAPDRLGLTYNGDGISLGYAGWSEPFRDSFTRSMTFE